MRALIYEPEHGGHRLDYVRHVALALRDLVPVEIVLGSDAPASTEFAVSLAGVAGELRIHAEVPAVRTSALGRAADKWRAFVAALRRHRPDHVFVPYGDGLAQLHGALPLVPRGVEIEGLLMRAAFAYPQPGTRARLTARLSRALAARAPWTTVHHLDPLAWEATRGTWPGLQLMPDPVDAPRIDRHEARRTLGLPPDARIAGCAGAIDERKGMDLLLRAFARVAGPDDRLLLAGKLSPRVRAALQQLPADVRARVHAPDRFLDAAAFDASIAAMDLVCTPYPDHVGSASIVLRAAAAGRPVLGADTGWMQAMIPRFGLGATVTVRDADALAGALASGLEGARSHVAGPAAEALVRYHSHENFAARWTARIRARLGLPQASGSVAWEDVLEVAAGGRS